MTTPAERLSQLASQLNASGVVPFAQVTTHTHVIANVTDFTPHVHVHGEQFTGNAVLTQFTLAHTPLYGVSAFVAGVRLDVTLAAAVLTFAVAPALAAVIRVDYEYAA